MDDVGLFILLPELCSCFSCIFTISLNNFKLLDTFYLLTPLSLELSCLTMYSTEQNFSRGKKKLFPRDFLSKYYIIF